MRRRLHPVGNAQRLRILKRDDYICQYCFEGATEIDHIIPYSYIPCNLDENLVASCGECNRLASNMVFDSFLDKYMYIKRRREQRGIRRHSLVVSIKPIMDEAPKPPKEKVIKLPKVKVEKPPKIIKPPKPEIVKPEVVKTGKSPKPKPAPPIAAKIDLIGFFCYAKITSVDKDANGNVTSFAFIPINTLPKDHGGGVNDPEIVEHVFKGFRKEKVRGKVKSG